VGAGFITAAFQMYLQSGALVTDFGSGGLPGGSGSVGSMPSFGGRSELVI